MQRYRLALLCALIAPAIGACGDSSDDPSYPNTVDGSASVGDGAVDDSTTGTDGSSALDGASTDDASSGDSSMTDTGSSLDAAIDASEKDASDASVNVDSAKPDSAVVDSSIADSTKPDSAKPDSSAVDSGNPNVDSGTGEPPGMSGMLAAHNAARAAVDPPATPPIPMMKWSSSVAATAQAYAEKCKWGHSGTAGLGENIYASTNEKKPASVVASWVAEKAYYTYATNSCSKVCGHYTQVVWRDSTSLGCGHATCSTGSPFGGGQWEFWVCNYQPPGNFNGKKPY